MGNKKTLIIVILAFVLLLAGAYVLYGRLSDDYDAGNLKVSETPVPTEEPAAEDTEEEETVEEDAEEDQSYVAAPDFTVYDIDGNEVHLTDFIGKPIVLNFWASWCGPCKSEMPDFNEVCQELGEEIQFLMVNMTDGSRETVETASEFVAQQGYTFPVFYDTAQNAAMVYGVYSLPTTLFIDAEGYLTAYASGAIPRESLLQGIDMIR